MAILPRHLPFAMSISSSVEDTGAWMTLCAGSMQFGGLASSSTSLSLFVNGRDSGSGEDYVWLCSLQLSTRKGAAIKTDPAPQSVKIRLDPYLFLRQILSPITVASGSRK